MALYRPPKPRWPLAIGCAFGGLAVGLLLGLALGNDEVEPVEAAGEIQAKLAAAAGSLEVAQIEYAESVQEGEVVREAEYEGALGALDSSRARYDEVRPALEAIFPSQTAPLEGLYDQIEELMRDRADADEVGTVLEQLEAILKGDV